MVSIFGAMVGHLRVNGIIISFMEKDYLHGLMVGCTKGHMKMMQKVDLESTLGQMERSLKGNG